MGRPSTHTTYPGKCLTQQAAEGRSTGGVSADPPCPTLTRPTPLSASPGTNKRWQSGKEGIKARPHSTCPHWALARPGCVDMAHCPAHRPHITALLILT